MDAWGPSRSSGPPTPLPRQLPESPGFSETVQGVLSISVTSAPLPVSCRYLMACSPLLLVYLSPFTGSPDPWSHRHSFWAPCAHLLARAASRTQAPENVAFPPPSPPATPWVRAGCKQCGCSVLRKRPGQRWGKNTAAAEGWALCSPRAPPSHPRGVGGQGSAQSRHHHGQRWRCAWDSRCRALPPGSGPRSVSA